MARLNQSQVLQAVLTPKNRNLINEARKDEARIIMHTEPVRDLSQLPMNIIEIYFAWVGSFLPAQKLARFKQLITTPIDTIESTKGIFDELSKFLDAQDQYFKFEFSSETIASDFNDYRTKLGDEDFWRTKAYKTLQSNPSSFLVVDLAAQQATERPEPYYYFVSIFDTWDVDLNSKTGAVEYLIFSREDGRLVCIDDEFYRVLVKPENEEWKIELENPHTIYSEGGQMVDGLGYAPACSFFDNPIYKSKRISKRGPVTDSLGKLDWLLFWRVSKRYLDCYGAWPIVYSYTTECNYRDAKGNQCMEGYINAEHFNGVDNSSFVVQTKCPACEARALMGPGSYAEVKSPRNNNEADLMENGPIKFVEMSNDKLEYGVKEAERLEAEIYLNCVGTDGEALDKQAVNESQVKANYESKDAILDRMQFHFERSHKFAISTLCRLRYGNYYTSGIIDYGKERFLKSVADLTGEYNEAKNAGLPLYYLSTLRNQITRTRFKNNPDQLERDNILQQLEPWPDLSITQCATFAATDPKTYLLKVNFTTFVQRFEREQMNVVEFGSLINFASKINLITQKLNEYVTERFTETASTRPQPGGDAKPTA